MVKRQGHKGVLALWIIRVAYGQGRIRERGHTGEGTGDGGIRASLSASLSTWSERVA